MAVTEILNSNTKSHGKIREITQNRFQFHVLDFSLLF